MERFYLYRFLDAENKVIYIGRTNSMERRLTEEHFTDNGNVPAQGYAEVETIEYTEINTYSQQVAYEAILIATTKPKYNIEFNDGGVFDFQLPEISWTIYDCNIPQLKTRNSSLHMSIKDLYEVKRSICTGFFALDHDVSIRGGSLTLVASISQGYKTALALNICNNMINKGYKVLYINLKDSSDDLVARMLSINSLVSTKKIYDQEMSSEEWVMLAREAENLSKSKLSFSFKAYEKRSIYDLVSDINSDFSLVVVDDVYSIDTDNVYGKDKTYNIMRILKAVAIDKKVPIIALAPVPRSKIEKRVDKRPMFQDIEYDSLISYSDTVLFLYKECNPDEPQNILEVIVAKNNAGGTGIIKLAAHDDKVSGIELLGSKIQS